uniref:ITA6 n=1 Tax=Taenia asiatica TaxID=60517 RepID=A0A0R3VZV1_TAEAS
LNAPVNAAELVIEYNEETEEKKLFEIPTNSPHGLTHSLQAGTCEVEENHTSLNVKITLFYIVTPGKDDRVEQSESCPSLHRRGTDGEASTVQTYERDNNVR